MNKKLDTLSPLLILVLILLFSSQSEAARPSDFDLKEGDLISAIFSDDPDVYIINEHGYKRLFLNPEIFEFYGHLGGFVNVKLVTSEVRDAFTTSGYFRNCENNDVRVYGVDVSDEDMGILRWIDTSGEQAVNDDADFFRKVFCINNKESNWYPKGKIFKSVSEVPRYKRVTTPAIPVPTPTPQIIYIPVPTPIIVYVTPTPTPTPIPAPTPSVTMIPTVTASPTPTPLPTFIVKDDFENGFGDFAYDYDWNGGEGTFIIVENGGINGGNALINKPRSGAGVLKIGNRVLNGRQNLFIKINEPSLETINYHQTYQGGAFIKVRTLLRDSGDTIYDSIIFDPDGNIYFQTNKERREWQLLNTYNFNQWYPLITEWRSSDRMVRYSIDGQWTDWHSFIGAGQNNFPGFDAIILEVSGSMTAYFDDFY